MIFVAVSQSSLARPSGRRISLRVIVFRVKFPSVKGCFPICKTRKPFRKAVLDLAFHPLPHKLLVLVDTPGHSTERSVVQAVTILARMACSGAVARMGTGDELDVDVIQDGFADCSNCREQQTGWSRSRTTLIVPPEGSWPIARDREEKKASILAAIPLALSSMTCSSPCIAMGGLLQISCSTN